jgi:hypothetical protein
MFPKARRADLLRSGTRQEWLGSWDREKPSDGLEPSTPSLPWRFRGVTRVHGRSLATHFLLQIELVPRTAMRRETSRVSFLMCPFCVRRMLLE